jgi:hypothetical protein
MFIDSVADDALGMGTYVKDGQIRGAFSVALLRSTNPAA